MFSSIAIFLWRDFLSDLSQSSMIFLESLLYSRALGFGFLVCGWRGFSPGDSGCFMSRLAYFSSSLTISSLAIRTWQMQGAQTLSCLVIPVQPIQIPFQVFCTLNFERFCIGINILTLVPKIRICSRFFLTFVQASSRMIVGLSCFIGRWL